MTVEYSPAPAVAAIAQRLIKEHHVHLAGERIVYVFRSEHAKEGGKAVFGKARKIGGLNAYLSMTEDGNEDDYFVIEIAYDIWLGMSDGQRVALVDHELSHCIIKYAENGDMSLAIAPHDLEEFNAVVKRHGLWRSDVKQFLEAASGQLRLLDDETGEIMHGIVEEAARRINDGELGPDVTATVG